MLASDKTHLTNQKGGAVAHPLYISLGNIRKDTRAAISRRAWMLLAYIPILGKLKTKFRIKTMDEKMPGILSNRLYHKSIAHILSPLRNPQVRRAVDAEGYIRETWRLLLAWIADMEEQWIIGAVGHFSCPWGESRKLQLDSPDPCTPRSAKKTLAQLASIRAQLPVRDGVEIGSAEDTWAFASAAKKIGLSGVELPFWAWMLDLFGKGVGVNIFLILSPDLLHSFHKCFADHILDWNSEIINKTNVGLCAS